MASQLFRNSLKKEPVATRNVDVERSSVAFAHVETLKDGDGIRECRADSTNVVVLTPAGEAAVALQDQFVTAMVGAMRKPMAVTYVLRTTADDKVMLEVFPSPKP